MDKNKQMFPELNEFKYDFDAKTTKPVKEFLLSKKGICYDFVNYIYHKNNGMKCYFIYTNKGNNTHTFALLNDIWIEYAWKTYKGEHPNFNYNKIVDLFCKEYNCDKSSILLVEYKPNNKVQTIKEFCNDRFKQTNDISLESYNGYSSFKKKKYSKEKLIDGQVKEIMKIKSKKLTDEQVKEIIKIKDENITKTLFLELFGRDAKTLKVKYNPNDWFLLVPGMISVYKDKIPLKTTIGRFIFNRFLNEGIFETKFPYFNGSKYNKFDEQVTDAYIEGEITPDQLCTYQTKRAWLEYTPVEILVPGISFSSITPHPAVIKRREELFKKYEKELAAGDVKVASAIEAELIELAKEVNKGDPSMRLYDLKKPSLGNNFKNIAVMVGPLPSNSEPGKYYIAKQSYVEGIPKENYDKYADQLIFGSWSRSVNTQVGGAQVKEMQAAMQSEIIDLDPNSDCGTKLYATIELNENNIDMYYWKYAITPKGLVMITKKNASQFIGKAVKIRSALYCKNANYCEKCTGAFYNRMKISNAGLTCFLIGSKIQNLSMKAMHSSIITTKELEWQKYFSDYRQ